MTDESPIELAEQLLDLLRQDQQFGTPPANLDMRKAIVAFLEILKTPASRLL